jgi:hypothetical protein
VSLFREALTFNSHRILTLFSSVKMFLNLLVAFGVLFSLGWAQDETKEHGEGAEGTEMGPVAFLWPADRPWDAKTDNTGPCGSPDGPKNRTEFPLTSGAVALSVADEAWNIEFSLAISNGIVASLEYVIWT